jgi:hypothetical protein
MKVTYCQDAPKRFICDQPEADLPAAGGFVDLQKGRYLIRRVERAGREAVAYVVRVSMPAAIAHPLVAA